MGGIMINNSYDTVLCSLSPAGRADKRYSDQLEKDNPIVEVRGTFKSGKVQAGGGVWVSLDECTIVSLPSSSGS